MVTLISHSPQETEAHGERWGQQASAGLLIGLGGDLGAGKTQLVRGIARGLGFTGRVHSPTFALMNQYEGGRLPLVHLDLYRLAKAEDVETAGLTEYLDHNPGVIAIEWVERYLGDWYTQWVERANQSASNTPHAASPFAALPHSPELRRAKWRLVWLEVVSETERSITYEDFGD